MLNECVIIYSYIRPLQLYLLAHWAPVTRNLQALIPVKHDLLDHHLHWWLVRKCTRAGTLLDVPEARTQLFTDASESGWGAHLDTAEASGVWSAGETSLHINQLELLAVYNALIAFRNHLNGMTIQLMSDNSTVVSYLAKQGGTVSVHPDTEDPASSSGRTYNHPGQTHSGGEKCISRPPFPEEQSSSHGMDFVTDRSGLFVHHMGHAERRSVCHTAKQSTSGIRVPHGRCTGSGHRRTVDSMERDVRIRISIFRNAGTSNREHFFMFLFNVKQLNPRTIKGYRSAISSTISSCGSRTEFAHSAELASLIRSFQLERPPRRKVAPQWNLSLVLQALLKPPFEPIARCDLKSLTLKTIFLVALTSGRRRSELDALCFDSYHFRQNQDQSMITLYPALDFIAKSQALDAVADPIKLKAFTSVGSADTDRRLCPVRALLQYRKTTATPECRKGRSKLFISYKPSMATEIKKATISAWIVKLIRLAYSTEGEDPRALELHKISAHEVRALSPSCSIFRSMSVDTVLQSCTWKSRNTLSDFYLRDMCTFVDDVYVMSSSVAGV